MKLGRDYLRRGVWLIPASLVLFYAAIVTIQFQVLRYFKDGLSLLLVRQLGGGSVWSAIYYAAGEMLHFVPLIAIGLALLFIVVWIIRRISPIILKYHSHQFFEGSWITLNRLILLNLFLLFVSFIVIANYPVLNKKLGYSLIHQVYTSPWQLLTDFDFDGYSLVSNPADQAPFDPNRHPYALEKINNAIDENGVGGDLRKIIWHRKYIDWTGKDFHRKNVLLIVLESARSDLYSAKHKDRWVMPILRGLPGNRLNLIAHTAFTAPSIISIMKGVQSTREKGTPLIDIFNRFGYRTGIFSAQNESFGRQDTRTGMHHADAFHDSRSTPSSKRMHLSNSAIASALPANEVYREFEQWLRKSDEIPFFSYINLQELHFPYSYTGIDKQLLEDPIPRYEITAENKEWLQLTYYNTAHVIDNLISDFIELLKDTGQFENTVILIIGDHGEELFDHGSLGHGTDINYAQNSTLGKLINSDWKPGTGVPIGLSEIPKLIYNSLIIEKDNALPLSGSVLAFPGAGRPSQIGLFTVDGLVKYDFRKDAWSKQTSFLTPEESLPSPYNELIHLWESYVLALDSAGQ